MDLLPSQWKNPHQGEFSRVMGVPCEASWDSLLVFPRQTPNSLGQATITVFCNKYDKWITRNEQKLIVF